MHAFKTLAGLVFFKLITLIILAFFAGHFIPYKGLFSFPEVLDQYQLPMAVKSLANFDGIHYISIAENGYYQYGQAFFPLFPLLINGLSYVFLGNELVAGLVISNVSFCLGLWVLYKWWQKTANLPDFKWLALFLVCFPTAFFFHAVYTESLFFLLVAATLYLIQDKKVWWAGVVALLASVTRVTGLFLVFPLMAAVLPYRNKSLWLVSLFPVIGLSIYMTYLFVSTGDPLAFIHAQSAFGAGRSVGIVLLPQVYFRYLNILLFSDITFSYWVAVTEVVIFSLMLVTAVLESWRSYVIKNWQLLSLGLFSLMILLLPTLTGTLLSTPRFVLLSLSSFIWLSRIKNTRIKMLLASIFVVLQVVLFAFFVQGYFVS